MAVGSLSHPKSGLPEFGTFKVAEVGYTDFGWEREATEFAAPNSSRSLNIT